MCETEPATLGCTRCFAGHVGRRAAQNRIDFFPVIDLDSLRPTAFSLVCKRSTTVVRGHRRTRGIF